MTTELFYLALTAVLAGSMWIPFVVGVNLYDTDPPIDFAHPPELRIFKPWVQRAYRAHLNLIEQGAPFAVLVLVAHLAEVSTAATVWATVAFFWLRVIHAVGMVSGWLGYPARPIVFTAGWFCLVALGWEVLMAG